MQIDYQNLLKQTLGNNSKMCLLNQVKFFSINVTIVIFIQT